MPALPPSHELVPIWIAAFTGHRPEESPGRTASDLAACRPALKRAFEELAEEVAGRGGRLELMVSAAAGSDLMAIEVADALGLPVHLILPMPEALFVEDFRDEEETWARVAARIERARDPRNDWTIRIAQGNHERPSCYHDVNLQMLESADAVVAICREGALDEEESKLGSSASMIAMSEQVRPGTAVIVIDPEAGGGIVRRTPLPGDHARDGRFTKLRESIASPQAAVTSGREQRGGDEPIWDVHRALDNVANHESRVFRRGFLRSLVLHFSATTLAAVAASLAAAFPEDLSLTLKVLTGVEVVMIALATFFVWKMHGAHANRKWRRARFGAELVDGQIRAAGIVDPLRPIVMRHDDVWMRFAIAVGLRAHREQTRALADAGVADPEAELVKRYFEDRVGPQVAFFTDKGGASQRAFDRWSGWALRASTLALIVITLALVLKIAGVAAFKGGIGNFAILFLPIFLPLFAGFASSMFTATDAARRASRYSQVRERLEHLLRMRSAVRTQETAQRIVHEIEGILMDEVIEWRATAETMEHLH